MTLLDALNAGQDGLLVTGPASGKSLAYQLPILERRLADPEARALILYPAKALARDQLRALEGLIRDVEGLTLPCGAYDGDTSAHERRKLRDGGGVVLANPDILHASILPQHPRWARFFANLQWIVLDEVHVYAGLFGANLAFLIFNFRPARIFMGDAGSFFLGFTLAALGVMGKWNENRLIAAVIPVLILGVPIADFAYVLVTRILRGETRTLRSVIAHCGLDHFSHRLIWIGFTQRKAVLFIYLVCVALGITGILLRSATNAAES